MQKHNFTDYNKVKEVLEKNDFFGFTCGRDNGRLTHKFLSIRYHCVEIDVVAAKLQPKQIQSDKIVLSIKVNGREINGWEDLINTMKNLGKIQFKEFPKTFKNLDNYAKDSKRDKHCHRRS